MQSAIGGGVGRQVRELRTAFPRPTLRQLGKMTGTSTTSLHGFENGTRSLPPQQQRRVLDAARREFLRNVERVVAVAERVREFRV